MIDRAARETILASKKAEQKRDVERREKIGRNYAKVTAEETMRRYNTGERHILMKVHTASLTFLKEEFQNAGFDIKKIVLDLYGGIEYDCSRTHIYFVFHESPITINIQETVNNIVAKYNSGETTIQFYSHSDDEYQTVMTRLFAQGLTPSDYTITSTRIDKWCVWNDLTQHTLTFT